METRPVIVALLILIVLILLFGAGVVKGWIANAVSLGCGGLAIIAALLWLGSFFGENGVQYVLWTAIGLMLLFVLIGAAIGLDQPPQLSRPRPKQPRSPPTPPQKLEAPAPKPPSPRQRNDRERSRDRVWSWYADDIEHRFSPEAKAKARELYGKSDALGLDRLCREEVARLAQ